MPKNDDDDDDVNDNRFGIFVEYSCSAFYACTKGYRGTLAWFSKIAILCSIFVPWQNPEQAQAVNTGI